MRLGHTNLAWLAAEDGPPPPPPAEAAAAAATALNAAGSRLLEEFDDIKSHTKHFFEDTDKHET